MSRYVGIVLVCAGLWGCVDQKPSPPPQPPASPAEQTAAMEKLLPCMHQKVVELDDGVSDAQTIARALVSACHVEFHALGELAARSVSIPHTQLAFLQWVEGRYQVIALREVLAYRASLRKQHQEGPNQRN